jgi:hypothetical protein
MDVAQIVCDAGDDLNGNVRHIAENTLTLEKVEDLRSGR